MRALSTLLLAVLIGCLEGILLLAGVMGVIALLTPVPALDLSDGVTRVVVPLGPAGFYTYSYINSVYDAPVEEVHLRADDGLRITSVFSADIRAVEYFRWDGEPQPVGGRYRQSAPPNDQPQLVIRVTPQYRQQITCGPSYVLFGDCDGWKVDLADQFGDGLVRVSPARMPWALVLLARWRR